VAPPGLGFVVMSCLVWRASARVACCGCAQHSMCHVAVVCRTARASSLRPVSGIASPIWQHWRLVYLCSSTSVHSSSGCAAFCPPKLGYREASGPEETYCLCHRRWRRGRIGSRGRTAPRSCGRPASRRCRHDLSLLGRRREPSHSQEFLIAAPPAAPCYWGCHRMLSSRLELATQPPCVRRRET
jgi:hypothetical protein